jgi:hypothetical protein
MARRYDEVPGSAADSGSSLRGALKGWYKHGACRDALWSTLAMPRPAARPEEDWWLDAARRPLGAYYRVDTRSVTDMHVALHDVGILYASAVCHAGWLREGPRPRTGYWTIPREKARADDGGHAFAIVGYTAEGFVVQNSWGTGWGTRGLAVLTYEDWTEHAMDCWVAQLGVATEQHLAIARSPSLRVERQRVQIAGDATLRNREIAPFIVDMENNGRLSASGIFRTQKEDVAALVGFQVGEARRRWGLGATEATDVAIYAHGGLTDEETAAQTAARWIPALYEARIFPIFLMWETDLWSTLRNRLEDLVAGLPRPTAGLVDQLSRFWNQRLERLLAPAGSVLWGEMKQNADGISAAPESGGLVLYESAMKSPWFGKTPPARLHLIGHSAGSIVHCHVVDRLARRGWTFESVTFLAAAATVELFRRTLRPRIEDRTVRQFRAFHLTDTAEQRDPTCRPILGYGRSLLYLVSESFEGGARKPVLGMERDFGGAVAGLAPARVKAWTAPGPASASTTHGGFDEDPSTLRSIIRLIKGERV